jgi:hypothetical protein
MRWVARAGLFGEVQQQGPKPGAMGLRNLPDAGALGRLGAGTRERAPMETRVAKHETLHVEHPEKSLPRGRVPVGDLSGDAFSNCFVASHEIGAHEPILVPEQGVQRCLGDTSSLNDAVDTDGMYAFLIEELIRGVEQSLAR